MKKSTIKKETLDFLKMLKNNNNREWFSENKIKYENAKSNFTDFTDEIIKLISKFDKSIERLEARNCVFRIYRDIRFSPDKTPYKTNFGATIVEKGTKTLCNAGYYLQVEPNGNSFAAGGVYITEPKNLKAIRTEISENSEDFLKIINKKSFKSSLSFDNDKLARVPTGFDKNDPMAEFLKFKQFTAIKYFSDEEVIHQDFSEKCAEIFHEIFPLNCFLNNAVTDI